MPKWTVTVYEGKATTFVLDVPTHKPVKVEEFVHQMRDEEFEKYMASGTESGMEIHDILALRRR